MERDEFLIAGGGIAGLAAALGFARIGRPSRLFEQHPQFEEVGAGLQISPNAVRALQWLGAWEQLEQACVVPSEIHVRDGRTGNLLQRIRLGKPFEDRFGAPYRVAHRADLLAALLAAAGLRSEIELNAGCAVQSASPEVPSVRIANGGVEKGLAIIAADGVRSPLRQQFWPGSQAIYRGHAIHRALITFPDVPPEIEADCVSLWLYRGGHVVHYAVSQWQHFNIVATIDSPWTAPGWSDSAQTSEVISFFADAADPLAAILARPKAWLKWAGSDIEPLETWTTGNLALIGDAAHATLPFLAQGAAMSLEDACVLARALDKHRGIDTSFAAYAGARLPRTRRIQIESRRLAPIYHLSGAKAVARNAMLKLLGPQHALARNEWIYDWRDSLS